MDVFRMGMAFHKIAMSLDDEHYAKIKPYLDELEQGIVEIIDDYKNPECEQCKKRSK